MMVIMQVSRYRHGKYAGIQGTGMIDGKYAGIKVQAW
jgi:hypothetical protein